METALQIKKNSIILDQPIKTINYTIETSTVLISGDEEIKNIITADLAKTFIKKDNYGYLFSLEIQNRKQSNLDGLASLENELSFIQKKLVLYCNKNGEIINIVNTKQIKEEWYFQKKKIKKEYKKTLPDIDKILDGVDELLKDNNAFIELINKSEAITLLFPNIYNQKLTINKQLNHHKIFTQFFDNYNLPLSLKTTLLDNKKAINNQIIRSGKINNNTFKLPEVKRFFRKLHNAQDLAVDIDVSYLETYDLGVYNNVYAATQLIAVEIDSLYRYRQISKLKKTTHV